MKFLSWAGDSACVTTAVRDSMRVVSTDTLPDDIDALKAALLAERAARRELEARAAGAEAMVAHLKLLIAKHKRDRFDASAERGRKLLDQLEMQLEELETAAAEDEARCPGAADATTVRAFTRAKPVRGATARASAARAGRAAIAGALPMLRRQAGQARRDDHRDARSIPRTYKVIQTVREKFSCRSCETITQPPAPFHPIARGRAGPDLLATIVHGKFGEHQPLNRQSESFAREGIDLSVSTLADWVGACTAALSPLVTLIARACVGGRAHPRRRHHGACAGQSRRPSPAGSGSTCATTVRSAARRRRRRSSTTPATAAERIPAVISRVMRASCRRTPMPGSTSFIIRRVSPVR